MPTIPITIIVRRDGIDVNPTYANVPNGSEQVTLQWTVAGGTFPTTNCFSWKNDPSGAPAVDCPQTSGERMLASAPYVNDSTSRRVWQYKVSILVDNQTVTIDPEVNNEPPGNA